MGWVGVTSICSELDPGTGLLHPTNQTKPITNVISELKVFLGCALSLVTNSSLEPESRHLRLYPERLRVCDSTAFQV